MRIVGLVFLVLSLIVTKCESCGIRQIAHRELVTHGYETKPGSYPWHVAIYHEEPLRVTYKCGGTLISEDTVLTAAHCAYDKMGGLLMAQRMILHFGKHNLFISNAQTREIRVKSIEIHPKFDISTLANDIAKIKLDGSISFSSFIQPICLWNKNRASITDMENKVGTVVGWGFTENDQSSDVLREATMPIAAFSKCLNSNRAFFGYFLSELNYCAGYRNGTSVCNGDSGGGMYFEENGVWKLRGIVSISTNRENNNLCSTSDYVLFTDVAKYLDWIITPKSLIGCPNRNPGTLPPKNIMKAEESDFPWAATLYRGSTFSCSATLISSRAVMTRASCVCQPESKQPLPSNNLRIGIGVRTILSFGNIMVSVSKIKIYEDYDPENRSNDLAILYLKNDVRLGKNVQPVCFPNMPNPAKNEIYFVSGWEAMNNELFISRMDTQAQSNCQAAGSELNSTICVKHTDQSIGLYARSDLLAFDGEDWYIRGIRQKQRSLWGESVFIFSDIAKYVNWIFESISPNDPICGKRNVIESNTGVPNKGEFPWHSMIYYRQARNMKYLCGGTLITKNSVLSLASCFFDFVTKTFREKHRFTIRFGIQRLHQTDQHTQELSLFKIIPHPDFNSDNLSNDLVVAVLANAVTFSNYIQPACLWDSTKMNLIENKLGSIISWGRQIYENDNEGPERVQIPIVSQTECSASRQLSTIPVNYTTNFCGGFRSGQFTSCASDSGVGLVFDIDDASFVRGVLNWGFNQNFSGNCTRNEFVTFVDVNDYVSWIQSETNKFL